MDANGFSWLNSGQPKTNVHVFGVQSDDDGSQSQSNYGQPINSPAASDSLHLHYSSDDEQLFDNSTENHSDTEETSDDDFIPELAKRIGYAEYKARQANAQAGTSSMTNDTPQAPSSSEPPAATVSTTSSSATNENAAQLEYYKSLIQEHVTKNEQFQELLKNGDSNQLNDLLASITHLFLAKITEQYDLVIKDDAGNCQNETNDKSSTKRKHRDGHRRSKKRKATRCSSTSSLRDLSEPSTLTPPRSDGNRFSTSDVSSCGSLPRSGRKRKQRFDLRYDDDEEEEDDYDDFLIPRQPKANPRHRRDDRLDSSVKKLKNTDKSLYLSSRRAKKCPLCQKDYKRMVSHFRRNHSSSEVFVSRVSPQMAGSLLQAQLPAPIRYVNASHMQHLKMMCPFCDVVKDFFALYWESHMRTHTGEYVNKCEYCSVLTMSTTHCGQPTKKPKCNLYTMGLTAHICIRCNFVQIGKKNIVAHLKRQHNRDRVAITSIENEYRKIVLIPPLKDIRVQLDPNVEIDQDQFMGQQPMIADDTSAIAEVPRVQPNVSRVQVIDDILIRPPNPSLSPNDVVRDDSNATEMEPNATDVDAKYYYGFEDDENDSDFEITGESRSNTAPGSNYSANIKVDTIDDQILENVADNYNRNVAVHTHVVRPWIEGDYGRKPSINVITQFALYKCMHEKCIFATNSLEQWFIHMTVHIQLIDYFKNRNALDKNTRNQLIKFRECSYCGYEAKSNFDVLRHLEEEHHRSIFQCSLCFYRTIEDHNMLLHLKACHPAINGQVEVYMCGFQREFNQQDDETLDQDVENNVKKMQCGQGDCTEEYACYNSLYAHLTKKHPEAGTYVCPYCQQAMGLDESMIFEHLSKSHASFKEFQCLKCELGFDHVDAIREHMSVAHPSNYLHVGARQAHESNDNDDEIQIVYVGNTEQTTTLNLVKCSQPDALNGMDAKELNMKEQQERLQALRNNYGEITTKLVPQSTNQPIPEIFYRPDIELTFITYDMYAEMNLQHEKKPSAPIVAYKCITKSMMNALPAIAGHINGATEVNGTDCKTTDSLPSMINHRLKSHVEHPIVFLQIESKQLLRVIKIVRCTFQCELCASRLATRKDLARHFFETHQNKWFAAKICIKSHAIELNDPKQPIEIQSETVDYYFYSYLICAQADCDDRRIGTRTQAIAHYNDYHGTIGSKTDGFKVRLCEKLLPNSDEIEPFVLESKQTHQMYLFDCKHCGKLFDSLAAIEEHFAAERDADAEVVLRFVVRRLFRCLHDNVIRTCDGLKQIEKKHPNVEKRLILPVNMLWPKKSCGICRYDYVRAGDLVAHYQRQHPEPNAFSCKLMDSLKSNNTELFLCKFVAECCGGNERNLLLEVIEHVLNCDRRFVCAQCPGRKFSHHVTFAMHCIRSHGKTTAELINELHNMKTLLLLLSDTQIILPNGLVVTIKEIRDVRFGFELLQEIGKLVKDPWAQEKTSIKLLTEAFTQTM